MWGDVMQESLINQIAGYIYDFHIAEGKRIPKDNIQEVASKEENGNIYKMFEVRDQLNQKEAVKLTLKNNRLVAFGCTCSYFQAIHSCSHIPAVLVHKGNELIKLDEKEVRKISRKILNNFVLNNSPKIKVKLNVEYEMEFFSNYYEKELRLKIKLGTTKLYNLGQKFRNFKNTYMKQNGKVYFGKEFEYDFQIHYFDSEDEKIFDYLVNFDELSFYNQDINNILKLFTHKNFYVVGTGLINGIIEGLPFEANLTKENNEYILKFDFNKDIQILTYNLRYVLYNNKIYHLNNEYARLVKMLDDMKMNTIVFNKKELDNFSKGLLPVIKNDLILDNNIKEISILNTSKVKLYFDLTQSFISCKIKLFYSKEIDYFDTAKDIVRDVDFENMIIEDLKQNNFKILENKIIIDDLDDMVEFMENGLAILAEKYQVYTSEKLKSADIIKKPKVKNNFSIGTDNIMRYDFEIDNVDSSEINDLLNSLRKKKKYHRLKNGNIVFLENDSLEDLNNLVDDLNINMKESSGQIPKYQAIYLDYLKKEKYPFIETNNLFVDFINNFKKYQNVDLKIDDDILRDYQKDGVKWLYTIYKCNLGGILADEMGLGKTIQTIYFIKELLKENKDNKFLIVCPTALVYNWVREFETFGKNINLKVIHGYNRDKKFKDKSSSVYITSYGTLREDILKYENFNFKAMIIDEAQNIKNPNALLTKSVKEIKAEVKIALTGTPLENSIVELWSIFDFIMPGFLGSLNKFNEKYHFKDEDSEYQEKMTKLKRVISPFIMRRKKQDVAQELPEKIENNIYIDLSEKQKVLYSEEVKKVQEEVEDMIGSNGFNASRAKILQLLTRLRQLCIDPRLVFENYTGESTKIITLIEMLKEIISNGHKILLFTSFKTALEIVKDELDKQQISYYVIDGSVSAKTRMELVDKFNKDETNVFLITIKSGGTGLNLTSADVVIHLDLWWNPQVENQATDRTHRLGQTKNVEVIKLITKGTIEERILELQNKKRKLSNDLIEKNGVDNFEVSSLTEKDIKKLLEIDG